MTAVISGFFTYVFLEPLFVPVGLDLAMVALWILAINASLVGMSLGVLLPTIFPGFSFGAAVVLLVGTFLEVQNSLYLPIVGGAVALVASFLSAR